MVMVMGSRLRRGCIIGALALLSTAAAGVIFKQWTSRGGDDTGVVLNIGEVGLEKEKDVHVNEVVCGVRDILRHLPGFNVACLFLWYTSCPHILSQNSHTGDSRNDRGTSCVWRKRLQGSLAEELK